MALETISKFNYGLTITKDNRNLAFDEGAGELNAVLRVGSYTLGEFTNEVVRAMNVVSQTNEFSSTLDRTTNKITINSDIGNFDLLPITGVTVEQSVFPLLGFTTDTTGAMSYEGINPAGLEYTVQFPIQKFIDFIHQKKAIAATVNESASGKVEVVNYGIKQIMQGNITLITDIIGQHAIENNPSGVADALAFMDYAITKGKMEFVRDVENPTIFDSCILESTSADKKGTSHTLKELYSRGLIGYFETGIIKFRKIGVAL